ncbi:hypothetical protein LMG7141_03228 [Ralstonia condita]|uniref:Uncharacterized protein n=1 Tax=Ralstonia condita TaxID=3058600 RepID=A0ABN9J3B9_9RALS|nr:hypothetical protein LMG7141_03228 [Ralstonia sp. LMG 7141]
MQDTQSGKVYVAAFNGAKTANGGEVIQGSCSIQDSGHTLLCSWAMKLSTQTAAWLPLPRVRAWRWWTTIVPLRLLAAH